MIGDRKRSIDRVLGAAPGEPEHDVAQSWLRDWPSLIGLAGSAALIAVWIAMGGAPDEPAAAVPAKPTAAARYGPGEVVNVGDGEVATTAPAGSTSTRHKKPVKHAAKKPAAPATPHAPATTRTPAKRSPVNSAPAPTGANPAPSTGAAKPWRVVNVTGTTATFQNGPLSYTFAAPTHSPQVGRKWRLTVSASDSGKQLAGHVTIDVLHQGAVVGHAGGGKLANGSYSHDFDWPPEAVGQPLTVKTTVVGGGIHQSFLFDVRVAAAAT
ncbi:MAG: hypothetical protein QOJ12_1414 [Thermoleophilales bacterium]|nr:hypothetical protein [Thermoleophilales bacterium]